MSWSDRELGEAYRALQRRAAPPAHCPDAAVLERYLLGTATETERNELADHLEECHRCAGFLQELRALSEWSERAAAAAPDATAPKSHTRWLLAIAASLALLVGGVTARSWLARTVTPVVDQERGDRQTVEPAAGARLALPPQRFDWPDETGATGYRCELYDSRADLLWQSDRLTRSECTLPAEVHRALEPGASYSWLVEVGGPVQRTQLGFYWFRIEPGE